MIFLYNIGSSVSTGRQSKTMANNKSGRKSASKMKPAAASKKDAPRQEAAAKGKKKHNVRKTATTVVIVFFAVLMALSMMLPSFVQIFSSNRAAEQAQPEEEAPTYGSDAEVSADTNTASVDGVFNTYADEISSLKDKLSGDSDNLAYILNLGQAYMNCAYQASQYASTDDDRVRVNEYFDSAIGYFDQYLGLQESDAVKVDRALCQLYEGDTSGATSALEQLTADSPDYGPAWANLGLAYEVSGDTAKAKEAYQKAEEADPDDIYGSYSFAQQRLAQINESAAQAAEQAAGASEGSDASDSTGVSGLTEALGGNGN